MGPLRLSSPRGIKLFLWAGMTCVVIGLLSSVPLGVALYDVATGANQGGTTERDLLVTGLSGVLVALLGVCLVGISRLSKQAHLNRNEDPVQRDRSSGSPR